ncbi:hypothetical protein [Advenella alkanexedens]|uniref:hypothetical protein n=1 Tax=Advenella alkanexedens TaxID=1481665 RepID=UPI0026747E60|nr:hypothetical protein [Advenella alkanexedens]WKU20224.1 hypothetical protein Q3V95_04075 [Advenella alkanexedens]
MSAYYQFLDRTVNPDGTVTSRYCSTIHAQGAWNPHEQHMAPASGGAAANIKQLNVLNVAVFRKVATPGTTWLAGVNLLLGHLQ